ncbi:LTA synthase family protein [Paenibacillus sp. TRM 82003]|nr:LTA synthase family protein [Paenibacillus sp. TRM 82003]
MEGERRLTNRAFLPLAIVLMWAKMYLIQRFAFDLPVSGWNQEWILLINPLGSVLALAAAAMLMFRRGLALSLCAASFLTSFILFADLVFYRFFNDFLTIPVLFQSDNMHDLGNSLRHLIAPTDALLFLDAVLLFALSFWTKPARPWPPYALFGAVAAAVTVLAINYTLAEKVRPDLLTRAFDRQLMVKNIGAINYHLYDVVVNARMGSMKALANPQDLASVERSFTAMEPDRPDPELFGIASKRNVFLISLESLQSFVMERSFEGHEPTPFLNQLAKESLYFDNFYHQTGQGKTSDAEFLIDTSLFPLPTGAVYFTHAHNTYHALASQLRKEGYATAAFHANDPSFWNRGQMYPLMGIDRFYSVRDYVITPETSVGWGLDDVSFFAQSVELASRLPQPFFGKFITLTNHYPFELDESRRRIPEYTSGSRTLNRYLPTVRYLDESVERFFAEVKRAGLYENSMFILYGDHYGISTKHNKAMAKLLGKERLTPFDVAQLQRVPLLIHIPGVSGRRLSTVSGQVDLKPTILHLLGLEVEDPKYFGRDLFDPKRKPFVVFRDGGFVTNRLLYTRNVCYDKQSASPIDAAACRPYKELANARLEASDAIVYGDLLRFEAHRSREEL